MKRILCVLLVLLLSVSLFAEGVREAEEDTGITHITIIGTSDMHGNIMGWSYENGSATTNDGMARLYTYIQSVRQENPYVLLIDAGDDIQGTIMTDDIYNKHPEEEHPVMSVMNYMGYDTMALGNHEFNWGIDTMRQITGQADFPILAANVLTPEGEYVTGRGWTIINVAGFNIAIIGVVTPDVPIWDGGKQGIDDMTYIGGNVAVKRAIEEIDGRADIIVVSAHMGAYAEFDEEYGSDSGQKILDDNPEIDVLQLAHYHVVVKDKQGKTVIGAVRNNGRDVARFDLYVDKNGRVVDSTVAVIDMNGVTPSESILNLPIVVESHERTNEYINGGGGGDGEGGAVLGTTTARFQPENEIRGIPEGRVRDTAVMDLINNVQLLNSGADVSSAALFKDTSDLPEGDITYANIFDIYKFDNVLYRVRVTGQELLNYMEWSAECYNQWTEGDISISFDPEYPDYLYDMFQGVDYEIDLSQPKGQRIKNVMFHGRPLDPEEELTLAVNNYRYSSALRAQNIVSNTKEWESPNSIRDMLVQYFNNNSPVEPTVDNNWKIVGVNLYEDDPRRVEIVRLINEGVLDPPYAFTYNLSDYEKLVR